MVSVLSQNIFFWDSSANTFTELTKELNKYDSTEQSLTFETGDRLYIASVLPFNQRFFKVLTGNSVSANLIVEYMSGAGWKNPPRVLDYTKGTNTFDQSGHVFFIPDNKYTISEQSDTDVIQDDNFKSYAPPVYNMFWQAIGFDATVTVGLSYVGNLFCNSDDEIYKVYPMLKESRLLEQWKSGKTDWEEQRVLSSQLIISELEKRRVIISADQILDSARIKEACIHHTAMTIFSGLGVDRFEKEIERASKRYSDAMKMDKYNVDLNADALLNSSERKSSASFRSR